MADGDVGALASDVRLLVGRLARRMRQEAAGGLTPSELSALATIEEFGPIQLGDLARVESVAPPTMTRAAARLEDRGLVRRTTDPADGRAVLVEVTAPGRRALRDLREARAAFLAKRLEALGRDDRLVVAEAVRLLSRLLSDP
ncbi:MAG TPA: MarR family transcriptional regulator [Acidimicrobiales bacterium]|jgi:DNA-binding MarR family transcriptional regulator